MRKVTKNKFGDRLIAIILSLVMILGIVPIPVLQTDAATSEHPSAVTITVKDQEGNPLSGVKISYKIDSKKNPDSFRPMEKETGADGTVEILSSSEFVSDDLTITATCSKDWYIEDASIKDKAIISGEDNIEVTLKNEISISGINVSYEETTPNIATEYEAVVVKGILAEDVVTYTNDKTAESTNEVPKISLPGTYNYTVKVQRNGLQDFVCEVSSTINKGKINGIVVKPYKGDYDKVGHALIESITGTQEGRDTITYKADSDMESRENPLKEDAGDYKVTVKVDRGENYEPFITEVTASINPINIEGLKAIIADSCKYDGNNKQVIKEISGVLDGDSLEYRINGSDWTSFKSVDEVKVKEVGDYAVEIRVSRSNYNTTKIIDLTPAKFTIESIDQNVKFNSLELKDTLGNNVDKKDLTFNSIETLKNEYDFSVVSTELPGATVAYDVVNDSIGDTEDINSIATIDTDGKLTLLKGGHNVKVIAKVTGDNNHNDKTVVCHVSIFSDETDLLSFPEASKEYVLGTNENVISTQTATKKYTDDNGTITYSAQYGGSDIAGQNFGIEINEITGELKVTDIELLCEKMIADNSLDITVKASKTKGTKKQQDDTSPAFTGEDKGVYSEAEASYTVTLKFETNPAKPYSLSKTENADGWFDTVTVTPADGYEIAKEEKGFIGKFGANVVYDKNDAQKELTRNIYLKNTTTGAITAPIDTKINKLDSNSPINVNIEYSTPNLLEKIFSFYNKDVEVTFTAEDNESGVKEFKYGYRKSSDAAKSILADYDEETAVPAVLKDGKYTATIKLPSEVAKQLRGSIIATAYDFAGNASATHLDDSNVIIVDTIKSVEGAVLESVGKCNVVGDTRYYSDDVKFTLSIEEDNFFEDDIVINNVNVNNEKVSIPVTWNKTEFADKQDLHTAEFTITEEGQYQISIDYKNKMAYDREGYVENEFMTVYTSDKVVIDKVDPVIEVTYSNGNNTAATSDNAQNLTVKITEDNFDASSITVSDVEVPHNNKSENIEANDLQVILRNDDRWTKEGNVHTLVINSGSAGELVDAIYNFNIDCKDLALRDAKQVNTGEFIVDHVEPKLISVSYTEPLFNKIIKAVTFGYYNPDVTVTFKANDEISGVDKFIWSYWKDKDASSSNKASYENKEVKAVQDETDKSLYTATVKLPADTLDQLNGRISYKAVDNYTNANAKMVTDENNVIIVDTISPKFGNFEFAESSIKNGNKQFFDNDIVVKISIKEANFEKEDVVVKVSKDGKEYDKIENVVANSTVVWDKDNLNEDNYVGTYTIPANADHANDGEYTFKVEYKDYSNNAMEPFEKTDVVFVMDTVIPEVQFVYSNGNNKTATADNAQSATIKVVDKYFDANRLNVIKTVKDINRVDISASADDIQNILRRAAWTNEGNDTWSAEITKESGLSVDGIYELKLDYNDYLNHDAASAASGEFVVDHTESVLGEVKYESTLAGDLLNKITFGSYKNKITVTFSAKDVTSGVEKFVWSYTKDPKASNVNLDKYVDQEVVAVQDTADKSLFTASVKVPLNEAEELRGNISFKAVDKYGNVNASNKEDKDNTVVVDNIAPELVDFIYDSSSVVRGIKSFYDKDVVVKFKVKEANFYEEDVVVKVKKNDSLEYKNITEVVTDATCVWDKDDTQEDTYIGTYTIPANVDHSNDGEYTFMIECEDHSANIMSPIERKEVIFVIDTVDPEVMFEYSNANNKTAKAEDLQTATVKVIDKYFEKDRISVVQTAKDINGNDITKNAEDIQKVLRNATWTDEGNDTWSVKLTPESGLSVDGIYEVKLDYDDILAHKAVSVESGEFLVDHTVAVLGDITYESSLLCDLLNKITFGSYKNKITVTFKANDVTSGVDRFIWSYTKDANASNVNLDKYVGEEIVAEQDKSDKSLFTASVKIPLNEAEELRGNISFKAVDKYGNVNASNKEDKDNTVVIDNICPKMDIEYSKPSRTFDGKDYYNKDLSFKLVVTEANFYSSDVVVAMSSDGGETFEIIKPEWVNESIDSHIGTFVVKADSAHTNDADYVFKIEYTDRSNNKMIPYTSNIKVIDTINPEIAIDYSNKDVKNTLEDIEGNSRKYFDSVQTSTITVVEHNFNEDDVRFSITAKDAAGNELEVEKLNEKSAWKHDGDVHTMKITYPGDANYSFDIAYNDLAENAAADYKTDYFTVDKTVPGKLTVNYENSVLDTILNAITFGFYNGRTTITINAEDEISGVHGFKYDYALASGVSNVNAELVNQAIGEAGISYSEGLKIATTSFTIPRDALGDTNQFNGTVAFDVKDRSENNSSKFSDTKRIVVDNITPTCNVTYNAPVQTENGVGYYDGNVNATVTVNEANFYSSDVVITVTKDGASYPVSPVWTDNSADVHVGTFSLSADGDYFVAIDYADKSGNKMASYKSEQMTVDTEINTPTITVNGEEANGRAFKEDVVPGVSFEDTNLADYQIKLTRTRFDEQGIDVTEKFMGAGVAVDGQSGSGTFDTFDKIPENDGIYTMTVSINDKAGHNSETTAVFTVNRFGSVYKYDSYLTELIKDGGAYAQEITKDLIITEYNADRLVADSLNIEVSRNGKPLPKVEYSVTPQINSNVSVGTSGWFQYEYIISKNNFSQDGVYKIAVSSKDATGNNPDISNFKDKEILFRVDSTAPEITSITGLEESIVNATEIKVNYNVYDAIGLSSIKVYVDDELADEVKEFGNDENNFESSVVINEKSTAQKVKLVVEDKAGNITDTSSEEFESAFAFNHSVTVSTNAFVRFYANKPLFFGSIAGVVAVGVGAGFAFKKRKIKVLDNTNEEEK